MPYSLDQADVAHNTGDAGGASPDITATVTNAVAPGGRAFLEVGGDAGGNVTLPVSVSGGGVEWYRWDARQDGSSSTFAGLFYADCPNGLALSAVLTVAVTGNFFGWGIVVSSYLSSAGRWNVVAAPDVNLTTTGTGWASDSVTVPNNSILISGVTGRQMTVSTPVNGTEDQDRVIGGGTNGITVIQRRFENTAGTFSVSGTFGTATDGSSTKTAIFSEEETIPVVAFSGAGANGIANNAAAVLAVWPPNASPIPMDIALLGIESFGTDPPPSLSGGTEVWRLHETWVQGGVRNTIFWSRLGRTIPVAPTISDTTDHQAGVMILVRGCHQEGSPFDIFDKGVDATSDTSGSFAASKSTLRNNCLIAYFLTGDLPDATGTAQYSAQANANLGSVTERTDHSHTAGNGGSLCWTTGTLATAGAIGTLTYTKANAAVKADQLLALMPPQALELGRKEQEKLVPPGIVGPGRDRSRMGQAIR